MNFFKSANSQQHYYHITNSFDRVSLANTIMLTPRGGPNIEYRKVF